MKDNSVSNSRSAVLAALLTRDQIAAAVQASPRSVATWTSQGKIPCVRVGGRLIRYCLDDVLSHLRRTSPKHGGFR